MDQVKVYFNSQIKRSSIPQDFSEFEPRIKALFNIEDQFGVYFLNEKGDKQLVSEETYENLKMQVQNSISTVKLVVGEPHVKEISYTFKKEEKQLGFPDCFFAKVQSNIDWTYTNARTYYENSKLPIVVEKVKIETVSLLDKIKTKIDNAFNNCECCNQTEELPKQENYFKELKLIRNNFDVNRSDQEILESLEKSKGDVDLALVGLF